MSSFEWLELESLTNDLDALRDHLAQARSRKMIARIRTLEEEIVRSDERRDKLLAHLTIHMISDAATRTQTRSPQLVPAVEDRAPEPMSDEHRAVRVADPAEPTAWQETIQAGDDGERSKMAVKEASRIRSSVPTPKSSGLEYVRASEQLARDEEDFPPPVAPLEALTKDTHVLRVRLAVAKLKKDPDLVRSLQKQIAIGEDQRKQMLANTVEIAAAAQNGRQPETLEHSTDQTASAVCDGQVLPIGELPLQPALLIEATPEVPLGDVSGRPGDEDAGSNLASPPDQITTNLSDDREAGGCDFALPRAEKPAPYESEGGQDASASQMVAEDVAASTADSAMPEADQQAKAGEEPKNHIVGSGASSSIIDPKVGNPEGETTMWNQDELERTKKEIDSRRDEMLERHAKELKNMLSDQAAELRRLDDDRNELEALEEAMGAALRKFKMPPADAAVTKLDDERVLRQQGLS